MNDKIVAAPLYDRAWTVASQQPREEPETSVVPVDLNLIVGDQQTHGQLGLTINMTCRLSNRSPEPLDLHRLAITAAYQGGLRYRLDWHLFYNAFGGEHLQAGVTKRITTGAKSIWQQGVQFRETRPGTSPVWNAGVYHFELLGWLNRAPSQAPNRMTEFRAEAPQFIEQEMMRFQSMPAAQWMGIHDRAIGFPVPMSDTSVPLTGSR